MSNSQHVELVQRYVGMLNNGDVPGYMGLYSAECVFHGYPVQFTPDIAGAEQFYTALVQGIPDAKVTPADVVSADDRVVVRYVLTGTHSADFMGVAASGHAITAEGITILRFTGGKVVERWNRLDDVGLLTQIGALPQAQAETT